MTLKRRLSSGVSLGLIGSEAGKVSIKPHNSSRAMFVDSASDANAKQTLLAGANTFYVTAPGANGSKGLSMSFIRNVGTNDAGTAHDVWRMGPHFKADSINQNTAAGGYLTIAQSNGAQDYALCFDSSPDVFGGSVHGGETLNVSQTWTCDGVEFDPTSTAPIGTNYELNRNSRITWSVSGATIDVAYLLKWEQDNKIEQTFTLTGTADMADLQTYPTLAFADARYNEVWVDGVLVRAFTAFGQNEILNVATREVRLRDPLTGDYVDLDFSVTGKAVTEVRVLYDTNYSKLYVQMAGGPLGTVVVTQNRTIYSASPPVITLPYTNLFSPLWKQIVSAAVTQSTSDTEWVLTSLGNNNVWGHPINPADGPGTYRVELDYVTDGAYTAAQVGVWRSETVSNANPLVALVSLNSTAGATWAQNINIAAGETPWIRLVQGVAATRTIRIRGLRITKV